MKSGREVGKVMGPLFPRLHVNDADKGGPRAPPRNKMALYEQFSVPSSRLNRSLIPPSQFPSSSSSGMVPSASNNQEARIFQQGLAPQPHASLSKEVQSSTSNGKDSDIARLASARSSQSGAFRSLTDQGNEKLRTDSVSSSRNLSKAKTSCQKIDDENDYSVPILENHECDTFSHGKTTNRSGITSSSHPGLHPEACERSPAGGSNHKRHQRDDEQTGKFAPKNKGSHDKSNSSPGYGEETEDVVMMFRVPQNHEKAAGVTVCEKSEIRSTMSAQVPHACDKMNAFTSVPRDSADHEKGSDWRVANFSQSSKIGVLENDDSDLGSSILDSEPGVEISPDDVFRVMGPKHYWKTRQILRNQQRVFAEQVFELHRVMKVQRCIAASPTILLEGNSCLPQPLDIAERHPSSKSGDKLEQQKQDSPCKDDPRKDNVVVEPKRGPPIISGATAEVNHDNQVQQASQTLENGHASGDFSAVTTSADSKHPAPWSVPAPGNQWLFPVMSPSEGLVYKPFMAPYHPNLGFMPPPYGGCSPMPMLAFPGGAFPIPIPMPGQEQGMGVSTNYFMSPHGLVPLTSEQTSPAMDRSKAFAGMPPMEHVEGHLPTPSTHGDSDAFSCTNQKVHPMRDHELQGSITSSSKQGKDGLCGIPLGLQPDAAMERPQVIKAVPHNPRTATESAARIFQSLQKDRQLFFSGEKLHGGQELVLN